MPINSKRKGKNGELEWARYCRDNGYDAHRTAQYRGNTGDAADVDGLPGLHVECKRTESLRLYDAMAQAKHDAQASGNGDIPIVAHRRNNSRWMIILDAEDFFAIYREWEAGKNGF